MLNNYEQFCLARDACATEAERADLIRTLLVYVLEDVPAETFAKAMELAQPRAQAKAGAA